MRWKGFRKVRGQVCKRLDRRIAELGLADIKAYQQHLTENKEEWSVLDQLCRITISRFYRDRRVFDLLGEKVLPSLAHRATEKKDQLIRIWSAGCASGEEPYTVVLVWHYLIQPNYPNLRLEIIATDIDPVMLKRSGAGCYPQSSVRELPSAWTDDAFSRREEEYIVKQFVKERVRFLNLDIRTDAPDGVFHVILCRNLAFTYFDQQLQHKVVERFKERLVPGGVLICGGHEALPDIAGGFARWFDDLPIFKKQ